MNVFELNGRVAIVTGGAKGIGKAVSIKLAKQGAKVHVIDVDEQGLNDLANEYSDLSVYQVDITNIDEVKSTFSQIAQNRLDLLVNNAGIGHVGNIEETSEEDFTRVFEVNVKGAFNCAKEAVKHMKRSGGGAIVNTASIAATVGLSDRFAYSASKGAVLTMTYSIAKDYLEHNIRCNAISPARIHTSLVDEYLAKNYPENQEEMFEKLSQAQPIGRMGSTEEIANLVLFLCSEEASFITGSNYLIDGGVTTLSTKI